MATLNLTDQQEKTMLSVLDSAERWIDYYYSRVEPFQWSCKFRPEKEGCELGEDYPEELRQQQRCITELHKQLKK
jgi:hypothetical protein